MCYQFCDRVIYAMATERHVHMHHKMYILDTDDECRKRNWRRRSLSGSEIRFIIWKKKFSSLSVADDNSRRFVFKIGFYKKKRINAFYEGLLMRGGLIISLLFSQLLIATLLKRISFYSITILLSLISIRSHLNQTV